MPTNPAETPELGKPAKIGISDEFSRGKIDRRISVAPMMDWTYEVHFTLQILYLVMRRKACHLYVTSESGETLTSRSSCREADFSL